MALYRVQVGLRRRGGLEEDRSINVWHVLGADPANALDATEMSFHFATFYQSIQDYLAATVSALLNGHTMNIYAVNIGGPGAVDDQSGSPILSTAFTTFAPNASTPLPAEVACALTLRGDLTGIQQELGATRPASRRRGRVFIGPISTNAVEVDAPDARPNAPFRTQLLDSVQSLNAALKANVGVALAVYSRTGGFVTPVVDAQVDNAWDTIRSRGAAASLRETRTI
jgi:hypothetical protein